MKQNQTKSNKIKQNTSVVAGMDDTSDSATSAAAGVDLPTMVCTHNEKRKKI
jgi:hypothetical protein